MTDEAGHFFVLVLEVRTNSAWVFRKLGLISLAEQHFCSTDWACVVDTTRKASLRSDATNEQEDDAKKHEVMPNHMHNPPIGRGLLDNAREVVRVEGVAACGVLGAVDPIGGSDDNDDNDPNESECQEKGHDNEPKAAFENQVQDNWEREKDQHRQGEVQNEPFEILIGAADVEVFDTRSFAIDDGGVFARCNVGWIG